MTLVRRGFMENVAKEFGYAGEEGTTHISSLEYGALGRAVGKVGRTVKVTIMNLDHDSVWSNLVSGLPNSR